MSKLPNNKIFSSPYKADIEQRLAMGQSPRTISKWLETRGEEISHVTITAYKKQFFNVEAKAAEVIKQKQEETKEQLKGINELEEIEQAQRSLIETQRNQAIGEIRAINHVALLYENIQHMRHYINVLQSYEPVVAAHAAKGLFQEIRATIESLEKIQANKGGDDESSVAKLLTNLKKQKRELEQSVKQQQRRESEASDGPTE